MRDFKNHAGIIIAALGVRAEEIPGIAALAVGILQAALDASIGQAKARRQFGQPIAEFQAVQFMPAVVFPQIFLCGLFVPREEMATWLRVISYFLPLTYAYDALARTADDRLDTRFALSVAVVFGCIVLAVVGGAATLRRRTD